jgi:hypothetical protein
MVEKIRDSSAENRRLLLVIGAIGVAIAAAMLPFTRFAIVLAVLAALVEDFWGAWNGKDSVIGRVFEAAGVDFNRFKEKIKDIIETVEDLWISFKDSFIVAVVVELISKAMDGFVKLIDSAVTSLGKLLDQAKKLIGGGDSLSIPKSWSDYFKGKLSDPRELFDPRMGISHGTIYNKKQGGVSNITNNFIISGAGDPMAVGDSVSRKVDDVMSSYEEAGRQLPATVI